MAYLKNNSGQILLNIDGDYIKEYTGKILYKINNDKITDYHSRPNSNSAKFRKCLKT